MPVTEKQKQYADKYIKNTFDEIKVRVPKGQKADIQAHAQARNESLNSFMNRAANETISRDTNNTTEPKPTIKEETPMPTQPTTKSNNKTLKEQQEENEWMEKFRANIEEHVN